MPTIFTDEDVQKYTRWQRFKMYAKIRAGRHDVAPREQLQALAA